MRQLICMLSLLLLAGNAMAADNFLGIPRFKGVDPVKNETYRSNCAECHYAYAPGLLPARSWRALLAPKALENHFGENAELDEQDRREILRFLTENAADQSWYKRSIKIMRSLADDATPLRITEVPYIKRKHSEIPARMVKENRKVRSLSYCAKCHTQAEEKGIFDDDTVFIPGFGPWDDYD